MAKKNKIQDNLLIDIAQSDEACFADPNLFELEEAQGLVIFNEENQDSDGNFEIKLTSNGYEYLGYPVPEELQETENNVVAYEKTEPVKTEEAQAMANKVKRKPINIVIDPKSFEIEDDVKIPEKIVGRGKSNTECPYPFEKLKIGQSFFVPCPTDDHVRSLQNWYSMMNMKHSKLNGKTIQVKSGVRHLRDYTKKWSMRKTVENDIMGYRVWAVDPKSE